MERCEPMALDDLFAVEVTQRLGDTWSSRWDSSDTAASYSCTVRVTLRLVPESGVGVGQHRN